MFFFSIAHIFIFYHSEIFLFIQESSGSSASFPSLFPHVLLQRSRMKGLSSILWSFCWILVPMTVTLKLQMQQEQTEPPAPFRLDCLAITSNNFGAIEGGWIQTSSKSCILPSCPSAFPSYSVAKPREGPCLCTIGMWPWRSDIIAKAVKTVFILSGYFPSHF